MLPYNCHQKPRILGAYYMLLTERRCSFSGFLDFWYGKKEIGLKNFGHFVIKQFIIWLNGKSRPRLLYMIFFSTPTQQKNRERRPIIKITLCLVQEKRYFCWQRRRKRKRELCIFLSEIGIEDTCYSWLLLPLKLLKNAKISEEFLNNLF